MNGECWFPTCGKHTGHHGQHGGLIEAGRRLAELERAIAEGTLVWQVP